VDAILAALEALSEQRMSQTERASGSTLPLAKPQPPTAAAPPVVQQTGASQALTSPPAAGFPAVHAPEKGAVLQGMFEDGNSLLRAVIAAEVLGPPVALRQTYERTAEERHFWKQQPNEPST
jgi:hypothetical protein